MFPHTLTALKKSQNFHSPSNDKWVSVGEEAEQETVSDMSGGPSETLGWCHSETREVNVTRRLRADTRIHSGRKSKAWGNRCAATPRKGEVVV